MTNDERLFAPDSLLRRPSTVDFQFSVASVTPW